MRYFGSVFGSVCGSLALALLVGCSNGGSASGAKPPVRVPAKGVVKLDGNPLAGAVITFLPLDEKGTITVAESKDDGSYELTYQTFPGGTAPGKYRVGVSFKTTPSGKTVTLGQQSALATPVDVIQAKERLPKKYSDLGTSELLREVPPEGGTFDFELVGPLIELPEVPVEPATKKEATPPTSPSSPTTPPAATKPTEKPAPK